jgi:BirA family transcriptional regulator, biotin operon repressor / biotin---[acetyl-CoA-carboxylase] ligase
MNENRLRQALAGLPVSDIVYYPSIGSTNDEALIRLAAGAPDFTLIVADEQTEGRGRAGRRWITPAGAALAFTLILRLAESSRFSLYAGLGALAICSALRDDYDLPAQIKWPNDVLLGGLKVAGVLVETQWTGDSLQAVLVGIGVNLSLQAVPDPAILAYPATCVEAFTSQPLEPEIILKQILTHLVYWRSRLGSPDFLAAWQENLAWKGQRVTVLGEIASETLEGVLYELDAGGALLLQDSMGETITIHAGDVRLRLVGAAAP